MSYVVLARKYRPMTFSDLVGQGHVSQTLSNAIAQGRVAHAFLFTGVRGVGKTTSARILAKALNCRASDGPTSEPCLECSTCQEITEGRDVDVQEIDGASYNGVDEVRRLQETLPYRPNRDRFKIVIVDEVHMLSNNAWNAFLKTLEEPPPHVKFIFATTEAHKVPITILSRVQRFDFKLIPARLIANRLVEVLEQEGLQAEPSALAIIAREAAGSMRDAMSLLDQVIAWGSGPLTEEGVAGVLGVASQAALHKLAQLVVEANAEAALHLLGELANQGFDVANIAKDLLALFRDIVVAATCKDPGDLLDMPDEERDAVRALAGHHLEDLLRVHQGFSHHFDDVVRSVQPRAALEMSLIRLCHRPPQVPVDDLIERLIKLEKRLYSSGAKPTQREPTGIAAKPPKGKVRAPRNRSPSEQDSTTSTEEQDSEPEPASPRAPLSPSRGAVPPVSNNSQPPAHSTNSRLPTLSQVGTAQSGANTPRDGTSRATRASSAPVEPEKLNIACQGAVPQQIASQNTPANPAAKTPFRELSRVERWRAIVDQLRSEDPKLGAFLDHAGVITVNEQVVHVSYEQDSVFRSVTTEAGLHEALRLAAGRLFGSQPEIHLQCTNAEKPGDTVFAADKQARLERHRKQEEAARNHPVVRDAVEILGARLKRIELPQE